MEGRVLRLFFALPLPTELREALGRWQCAQPGQEGWSRPEGLHLTLAFLGERSEADLDALSTVGAEVARRAPFPLRTTGLGGFPEAGRARVLWLGLEPSPALEALAADLRAALAGTGETFDPKPFRAHLTLARFRRARPLLGFDPPPGAAFAAERLVLFESRSQGRYAPVRSWSFREV